MFYDHVTASCLHSLDPVLKLPGLWFRVVGDEHDLPILPTDTQDMTAASPSLSSISTSSDDAPQLSFEYIWDDEGNFVRLSKRETTAENGQQINTQPEGAAVQLQTNDTLSSDVLGNERTAENAQSISSLLSLSYNAPSVPENLSSATPASRPFQRAVSGPIVTPGSHRASLLSANERPLGRARRVPIEEKRKEEAEMARKRREEEEREREARRLRMREKEKENWAGGVDLYVKDHHARGPLVSSLTRTQSEPNPALQAVPEQPEHLPYHSQPVDHAPYRPRRHLSKQQRVLSAVPRVAGKESFGVRTSSGSTESRTSGGSVEASPPDESRPPRLVSGGARRITKEERERQEREAEREATELQAQLERQEREERERAQERERELHEALEVEQIEQQEEVAREREEERERERYERSQSALSYRHRDSEEKEPSRVTHQRRESETVMPEVAPVPARLSPSARLVQYRDSALGSSMGNTQPDRQSQDRASITPQPGRPPGLSRSNSQQQTQSQPSSRGQHRRSPTAPEAHHTHLNGAGYHAHANGGQAGGAAVAKGKTWAMGAEVVGDVDRDLGGLGSLGEVGVREKDTREMKPPSAPVQVNGAKNFTVNGKTYGKLDMIGKGGSSRVYRVITPSNEIYALKRVSLDRTDQETMQGYMNEIALLRRLDGNERIIQLVESEVRGGSKGHLMLVMECGEVDLARLIAAKQSRSLDMVWVSYYWKQMLEAVHVIHEEKIVHSDLKPANFVLVKGELKLIDFGIANAIANDTTNIQRDHQIGTVNYMSPESIEVAEGNSRLKVGRPSDVWSLGCILYQMIYGTPPFHQLSVLQKMRTIPDPNNVIEFPEEAIPIVPQPRGAACGPNGNGPVPPKKLYHLAKPVPLEVIESLKSCLMKTPKERETIPQLLTAGWLHPKGRTGELNLSPDEVVIDRDLLRQVVTWAISVGLTTGMPKEGEEFEETLSQTLMQLQSCTRKR